MDWNWFFSSLSQSSAAIVGIFGAFIITKILSNQALFGERCARIKSLAADASKLTNSAANLSFAWYNRLNRENQLEKAENLLEKEDALTPEELYARLRFPPFLAREEALRALNSLIARRHREAEAQRQRIEEAARAAQARANERLRIGRSILNQGEAGVGMLMSRKAPGIQSLNFPHVELQKEREAIDALEIDIRHHMRTISDFLEAVSSNPESSRAITWALIMVAVLFLVGVIYPLSFMPTPAAWTPAVEIAGFWERLFSLQGMLLTFVSALFLAALTMFLVMNHRMRYPQDQIQLLEGFTHIETYSKYYAIADENNKLDREATHVE